MSDSFKPTSFKRKNALNLTLPKAPPAAPKPPEADAQVPRGLGNSESNKTDTLEIGLEFKLDLRSEDLIVLKEIGAGNGGTVSKVKHASTNVIMARKVIQSSSPPPASSLELQRKQDGNTIDGWYVEQIIRVDARENVRKQIVRELQVGQDCNSPYVITFYGAFQNDARDIVLCMEYMDCG
jgi:mitogen-activated protein kinase kinase